MNLRDFVIEYTLRASTGAAMETPAKPEDLIQDAVDLYNAIQENVPEIPAKLTAPTRKASPVKAAVSSQAAEE